MRSVACAEEVYRTPCEEKRHQDHFRERGFRGQPPTTYLKQGALWTWWLPPRWSHRMGCRHHDLIVIFGAWHVRRRCTGRAVRGNDTRTIPPTATERPLARSNCQLPKWSWCRSLYIQWSLCRCPPDCTQLFFFQERTVPPGRPGVCWNLKKKNSAVLVIANCTQAEEESMVVDKHKKRTWSIAGSNR